MKVPFPFLGNPLSIIFGLSFVLLSLYSCENDLKEIQRVIDSDEVGVEQAKDVEILYSDSAVVKVRLRGPTMMRYLDQSNQRTVFPDNVRVDFLDGGKESHSVLTAKYAIRYDKKDEIFIRDSVVWKSNNQETLETEELVWNDKSKKLYSNKFVTITTADEIIQGYGFDANQEFTHWKINAITGIIKVDGIEQ